ncbi:uncharacterized protein LOC135463895 [Liolophura sinensis]|uniref:uncharacterized protein LOC135463895 n=1 Tax=Liolophura sinensis TaxID=3198878 RepID=UPI00315800A8
MLTTGGPAPRTEAGRSGEVDTPVLRNPFLDRITLNKLGLYPQQYPDFLKDETIRSRILDIESKSNDTVVHLVRTVATLERWMWYKYDECRRIEDLPAKTLDKYLEEFYPLLRKPSGEDYTPDAFSNFRYYVERFLKMHKYPHSVSKSHAFLKSSLSFRRARKAIALRREQRNAKAQKF